MRGTHRTPSDQGETRLPSGLTLVELRRRPWVWILVAWCIYLLHAQLFKGWIVDDAGISFAYSKNLASGYGLVSQPGALPVEGYSNFTWVVLLAPSFWVGAFDPTVTPKVVSWGLVLCTFVVMDRALARLGFGQTPSLVVLNLLAFNTSFVVWTSSGLENALYVLAISSLLYVTLRVVRAPLRTPDAITAGLLASFIAMTRPEGILFTTPYVLIAVWAKWADLVNAEHLKDARLHLVWHLFTLVGTYSAFMLFRWLYFEDVVPNTYHVKGGPKLATLVDLVSLQPQVTQRLEELVASVAGVAANWLLIALIATSTYLITIRAYTREHVVLAAFLVLTGAAYLLLPQDWMREYRFATPFFVMLYAYTVAVVGAALRQGRTRPTIERLVERLNVTPRLYKLAGLLLIVALWAHGVVTFSGRSLTYAERPDVSFARIQQQYTAPFNRYARALEQDGASVLTPDIGAMLYYSELVVHDLAGLTDKTIARTRGKNQRAFHDYVFETIKPTFIHTHASWAMHAMFQKDRRFQRDYRPICESFDAYVRDEFGLLLQSGNYVRRAVVEGRSVKPPSELSAGCERPKRRVDQGIR